MSMSDTGAPGAEKDPLVCQMYGLTDVEIAVAEERYAYA